MCNLIVVISYIAMGDLLIIFHCHKCRVVRERESSSKILLFLFLVFYSHKVLMTIGARDAIGFQRFHYFIYFIVVPFYCRSDQVLMIFSINHYRDESSWDQLNKIELKLSLKKSIFKLAGFHNISQCASWSFFNRNLATRDERIFAITKNSQLLYCCGSLYIIPNVSFQRFVFYRSRCHVFWIFVFSVCHSISIVFLPKIKKKILYCLKYI